MGQNLFDERRQLCLKLFSMFQFRPVSVHASVSLVGDFFSDNTDTLDFVGVQFVVPLLIQLSWVLDLPLPFPVLLGTAVSSPSLHSPVSVLNTGCPPYPRILHPCKRILIPLAADSSELGQSGKNLLVENLRFLAAHAQAVPLSSVPQVADPFVLLSQTFNAPNLGRAIFSSVPSSPSISASFSPSSSYRKSVIEQSVTEGGEWTLLDQL